MIRHSLLGIAISIILVGCTVIVINQEGEKEDDRRRQVPTEVVDRISCVSGICISEHRITESNTTTTQNSGDTK